MQCGDWEEHAILLCNYFNYIDLFRKERVQGYSACDTRSYCVLCSILPEGEVMMVLRRDCITGHCELWNPVSRECFFLPCTTPPGFLDRLCARRRQGKAAAPPHAHPGGPEALAFGAAAALDGTPSPPVQRVHVVFSADNVWANLQRPKPRGGEGPAGAPVLGALCWDLDAARRWRPLFRDREELRRLDSSGQASMAAAPAPSGRGAPTTSWATDAPALMAPEQGPLADNPWIEPSQALVYEPPDGRAAELLAARFEHQLEHEIMEHRAHGRHGGVQQVTKFKHLIADRLGEVLGWLEYLSMCQRRCGDEAIFPLRTSARPPVTVEAVQQRLREIESDFKVGRRGCCVYGVPFNHAYAEVHRPFLEKQIWETVRDSRILEMGNERAEYAVKVRVFPYDCNILSVWVFVACATTTD